MVDLCNRKERTIQNQVKLHGIWVEVGQSEFFATQLNNRSALRSILSDFRNNLFKYALFKQKKKESRTKNLSKISTALWIAANTSTAVLSCTHIHKSERKMLHCLLFMHLYLCSMLKCAHRMFAIDPKRPMTMVTFRPHAMPIQRI